MVSNFNRNIDLWDYDFETDILFFRDNSLKYHSSIDLGDLMIEMEKNGPMGVELLNAATHFGISKIQLKTIQNINATIRISETDITATIEIFIKSRNANVPKVSTLYGVNDINLQPGLTAMVC
jgi:uncharacterized protein YuzE